MRVLSQPSQAVAAETDTIFYDGNCGLCHRGVRFVMKRDADRKAFRFAPLQGTTFAAKVSPERLAELPDTMMVQTRDGRMLLRSSAWAYILQRLGDAGGSRVRCYALSHGRFGTLSTVGWLGLAIASSLVPWGRARLHLRWSERDSIRRSDRFKTSGSGDVRGYGNPGRRQTEPQPGSDAQERGNSLDR